jgi:AICAR transformylase/IMP cyclohydrolase PurH
MSLKDTVRGLVLSKGAEWILRARSLPIVNTKEKAITDEMVEERIKELKPHHPVFAAILEKVHEMDLKEVVNVLVVIEGLRWILKIHAARPAIS